MREWRTGLLAVAATAIGVAVGYPAWAVFPLVWIAVLMSVGNRRWASPRVEPTRHENANLYYSFGASFLVAWRTSVSGPLGLTVALVVIAVWFALTEWMRVHTEIGRWM